MREWISPDDDEIYEMELFWVDCELELDDGGICGWSGELTAVVENKIAGWTCPGCGQWDEEDLG